jgi:hypothetical protein
MSTIRSRKILASAIKPVVWSLFEPPALPQIGQRVRFNREPKHNPTYLFKSDARKNKQIGVWQLISKSGEVLKFQQVSADGTRLVAKKTTTVTVFDYRKEINSGSIRWL